MTPIVPRSRFYVYILSRPDGRPFYVGKGQGRRAWEHITEAKRGKCICDKCKIIRSLLSVGKNPVISILYEMNSELEAYQTETATIKQLGQFYRLTNYNAPDPRPPIPSDATYAEFMAWVDRVEVPKKERDALVSEWARERVKYLRSQIAIAGMRHPREWADPMRAEIAEIQVRAPRVYQIPLTEF